MAAKAILTVTVASSSPKEITYQFLPYSKALRNGMLFILTTSFTFENKSNFNHTIDVSLQVKPLKIDFIFQRNDAYTNVSCIINYVQ